MSLQVGQKCNNTPLDEKGDCVTCAADAEGLKFLARAGYAPIRKVMELLEEEGFAPEMEQVPPGRPEEEAHPAWNLYVPKDELERAREFFRKDWAADLSPEAAAAVKRGDKEIDLDVGGEIECPACAHRFVAGPKQTECPDCGLSLGALAEATPDEAK
jgi:hypothetical protein